MLSVATIPAFCAGFNGVFVGQDVSQLPSCLTRRSAKRVLMKDFAEGICDSAYLWAIIRENKVTYVIVTYSGPSFEGGGFTQAVTLPQAVKMHSLQPGLAAPRFGVSKGGDFFIDFANRIAYEIEGTWYSTSTVKKVHYFQEDASRFSGRLVTDRQTKLLLAAARQAPAIPPLPEPHYYLSNLFARQALVMKQSLGKMRKAYEEGRPKITSDEWKIYEAEGDGIYDALDAELEQLETFSDSLTAGDKNLLKMLRAGQELISASHLEDLESLNSVLRHDNPPYERKIGAKDFFCIMDIEGTIDAREWKESGRCVMPTD